MPDSQWYKSKLNLSKMLTLSRFWEVHSFNFWLLYKFHRIMYQKNYGYYQNLTDIKTSLLGR